MLLKTLLFGLSVAMVVARPSFDQASREVQLFKRDAVLDARDLELAELHGVNLTEMYKHSVIKRDDNDHMTIWVNNAYTEETSEQEDNVAGLEESPEQLEKRQGTRLVATYNSRTDHSNCNQHDVRDITSSSSPFTGGVAAIMRWGWGNRGHFAIRLPHEHQGKDLIIGGTNSGRNARFWARVPEGNIPTAGHTRVGTHDIGYLSERAHNFGRQFSGRWRAAAYGWSTCSGEAGGTVEPYPRRRRINWDINWEVVSTQSRV